VSTTSARRDQIASSLQDKEYRDLFTIEGVDTGIPFQIRAMRQVRGWSQEELAARMGLTQEGISRLENPDYGRFSLKTLKRLASAFDVGLAVRFVPFSHLVDWAVNFSPDDLAVPDYEHDAQLHPASGVDLTAHQNGHEDQSVVGNIIRPSNMSSGVHIHQGERDVCVSTLTYLSDHQPRIRFPDADPDLLRVER